MYTTICTYCSFLMTVCCPGFLSNNRVKKKQLDAQRILSIFRQPLHVLGLSRPIIRRYNSVYTTIGTYYSFLMTVCCPGCFLTIV